MTSYPQEKLDDHVQGYQKTEDNAAKIYVDFQKCYVKLNSLLRSNDQGIVQLDDGVPGYFDL